MIVKRLTEEQKKLAEEHYAWALNLVNLYRDKRLRIEPDLRDAIDWDAAASLGLLDAVVLFDPSKGVRFRTYATYRIRNTIVDLLRTSDAGWSRFRGRHTHHVSTEKRVDGGNREDPVTIGNTLIDERSPERLAIEARENFNRAIRSLNQTEKLVMIMYYHQDATMKTIGRDLGLSESRVSQMHGACIDHIRTNLTNLGISA